MKAPARPAWRRKRWLVLGAFVVLLLAALQLVRNAGRVSLVFLNDGRERIEWVEVRTGVVQRRTPGIEPESGLTFHLAGGEHSGAVFVEWVTPGRVDAATLAVENGEQVIVRFGPGEQPLVTTTPGLILRMKRAGAEY